MLRRGRTVVAIVIAILLLLAWYVGYTRQVVTELRAVAATQGRMYEITFNSLQDTTSDADPRIAILSLQTLINQSGLPMVVTNKEGHISAVANVPDDVVRDSVKARAFIAKLDRKNKPIVQPGISAIHYGDSPIVEGLEVFPVLQASAIVLLLAFGLYGLLERGRADREKVWAGMAREAAHQLGTPLSSVSGWLELLGERENDATTTRAIAAMQQDVIRLERVSHRFERIGRPPRNDDVDAAALVERLANYFAARAPTLARHVQIVSERPPESLMVRGDGVLLEWVLEVLIKNAIDALGGRNGKITVSAQQLPEGAVRVRVEDNGPGIPKDLRKRIFHAGFTTKQAGWGIGLSLARRIVEENHGGKLVLVDTDTGAVFDVILHA